MVEGRLGGEHGGPEVCMAGQDGEPQVRWLCNRACDNVIG